MTVAIKRNAFKAYDIRGRVPEELNDELAYRLGCSFARLTGAKKVAVGRDVRLSSASLATAVQRGLQAAGCDVLDIGVCGTEMMYFAAAHLQLDGGIMVTASHNPMDYNGMKLVGKHARPISGDSGLRVLEDMTVDPAFEAGNGQGGYQTYDIMPEYISHLLTYINPEALPPYKVVVNAGNGCAGPVIDALEAHLPLEFIKIQHEMDGTFPNGIPNPLLPEKRMATIEAVRKHGADLGIAWDGDFDRCFFFDEHGDFIEGYYIVGFLAEAFLMRNPGEKIIYDPRLTWNTVEMAEAAGGKPVISKTGHAFIKERMRLEDAIYGGEMSAHHYFREFAYCDSGMIPWLLLLSNMQARGKGLAELVKERQARFPVSGEINRSVSDSKTVLAELERRFAAGGNIERIDGLSVEFAQWRFNVRTSNTEPLLRLNVESRGDAALMQRKTEEILAVIAEVGGQSQRGNNHE